MTYPKWVLLTSADKNLSSKRKNHILALIFIALKYRANEDDQGNQGFSVLLNFVCLLD